MRWMFLICNIEFTLGTYISGWTLDVEIYGKIKGRMFSKQGKITENIMVTLFVLWLNIWNAKELERREKKKRNPPMNKTSVLNKFSFLGNLAVCSRHEKGIFKSGAVTSKMRYVIKKIGEKPDKVSLIYCLTAFFPGCKYSVSSSKVPWNTTTLSTIWSHKSVFQHVHFQWFDFQSHCVPSSE